MELQKNTSYKILIDVNKRILTYICIIKEMDGEFITFVDDRGVEYSYNKKNVVSIVKINKN